MTDEWRELIKRYAGDRKVCNCGAAYYSKRGDFCKHGCDINLQSAKDKVAKRVLAELRVLPAETA